MVGQILQLDPLTLSVLDYYGIILAEKKANHITDTTFIINTSVL